MEFLAFAGLFGLFCVGITIFSALWPRGTIEQNQACNKQAYDYRTGRSYRLGRAISSKGA